MGKYTEQAKLAAVLDYRSGKAGLRNVADRHGVDFSTLRQWVMGYEIHGVAALKEKKPRRYSSEFKLTVLKRMNEERLSLRQTAALFDIRQFGIIGLWQRLHEEGTLTNSSKPPDKTGRPRKCLSHRLSFSPLPSTTSLARVMICSLRYGNCGWRSTT